MNIKRFFAADTRQAMQQVKSTLGADAVIISNRQTEDGVEIIAAIDLDEEKLAAAATPASSARTRQPRAADRQASPPQQPAQATAPAAPASPGGQSIEMMHQEINTLREMMEQQITSMTVGQWTKNSPVRTKLYKQLNRIGLEPAITTSLISTVNDDEDAPTASRKVLNLLTQQIQVTDNDILKNGGVVVLTGPSGSGRTTTLAKLAAQFIMENSTRDVLFISADHSRVGAHEQLLAYGRLFGIPVLRARDDMELEEIITATSDKRLVLVDSASLTPEQTRNPTLVKTLRMPANLGIKHYMVIPATLQQASMQRLLSNFQMVDMSGSIITKIDEAANLGDLITTLIRYKSPVAYWTDGQRVTAHLHAAEGKALVQQALKIAKNETDSASSGRGNVITTPATSLAGAIQH
ncbi:MAG: flagellar biosynthesis protein FlhF [bacterium]